MPSRTHHRKALIAALFVTFLWSSSWVLIRWGLDGESLEPLTFAALRYLLAAVLLLGFVATRASARSQIRAIDRNGWVEILLLGVVFYTLTQGAQFVAIDSQPAATTSVILSWTPLLVAMVGGWSIGESVTARQVLGAALVAAGAWAYFAGDLGATTLGLLAAGVALAANVGGALLGRSINRRADLSPLVVTSLSMGVGAGLLALGGVAVEGLPSISSRAWLIIVWLAVVNTALAFTLWNFSLRHLQALESAAINNTMLIQIAILAWVFLGEAMGPAEILGVVLVSVGVLLAQANSSFRRPGSADAPESATEESQDGSRRRLRR